MNPFLGAVFHWLGGLASESFYVPYKGVRKWAWEVYWLVGGVFSWIVCRWALAAGDFTTIFIWCVLLNFKNKSEYLVAFAVKYLLAPRYEQMTIQ